MPKHTRLYIYTQPAGLNNSEAVHVILNEHAITEGRYGDLWKARMLGSGKYMHSCPAFMHELCLDDFCSEFWAVEIPSNEYLYTMFLT